MTKEQLGSLILDSERQLYSTAKTILFNDHDCADAIQETIVKAFSNVGTLKNDNYARTWLIRILINECYSLVRKSSKFIPLENLADRQEPESSTVSKQILAFCTTSKSKKELAAFCGFKDLRNFILNKQRSRALGSIPIVLLLCLFCIDVPILIRPGAITIVCVSDPICVTIVIISVCCFYYINSTVTALKFMLFQLVSEMITFVIPGTI